MTSLQRPIETYIRAKDGNRPHLIAEAFAPDAELAMDVRTGNIAFPSAVTGAAEIARVLVSEFAAQYENVYTFCIGEPPLAGDAFECGWLVCMTEKHGGAVRVGHGRYLWRGDEAQGNVTSLRITIATMSVLPAQCGAPVLAWAAALPYPWCPADRLPINAPRLPAIDDAATALRNGA